MAVAVLLAIGIGIQVQVDAGKAGFGAYPDEPSHYVGGLMVRDYLTHPHQSPMAFAREYYLYQPYFAIGYWPPFFYILEGCWMLLFGYGRSSIMFLIGAIAVLPAIVLFGFLRRHVEFLWALPAAALFLLIPSVRWSTTVVMTDLTVALLCLLTTLALGRFFEVGSARWAVAAGGLAALAMLTKYLAFFAVVAPVVLVIVDRRWALLLRRATWLIPLVYLAMVGTWFAWTHQFLNLGVEGFNRGSIFTRIATLAGVLAAEFGPVVGILPLCSLAWTLWKWNSLSITVRLMALQPICGMSFLLAAPSGIEPRYLVPFLAPWIATIPLFLRGVTAHFGRDQTWAPFPFIACVILFPFLHTGHFERLPDDQLRQVSRDLVNSPSGPFRSVLMPALCEGPAIAELAATLHERSRMVMVRPSKLFARTNWLGTQYESLTNDLPALRSLVEELPIDVILIDEISPPNSLHAQLLAELVRTDSHAWRLQRAYPRTRSHQVKVYARVNPSPLPVSKLLEAIHDRLPTVKAGSRPRTAR